MILILDRGPGTLPPYLEWLGSGDGEAVLFTARPRTEIDRHQTNNYADVRCFADFVSGRIEREVVRLAQATTIRALVALAAKDVIRAGALRDHLGIEGQGREEAIVLQDLVASRCRLEQGGIPIVRCGAVQRVADLYWYGDCWGYPLRMRHRRTPTWPTAARLGDEADVAALTRGGLTPRLEVVPSLVVEPGGEADCRRISVFRLDEGSWDSPPGCPAGALALAQRALAWLAPSHDCAWRVELVSADAQDAWHIDTVAEVGVGRALVQAQAGLGRHARGTIR